MKPQPWIYKAGFDSVFILSPPFLCLLLIALFPAYFQNTTVSVFWWFSLVLCVDVAHVYSTIYRTYADKSTLKQHRTFLISLPVLLFVGSVLLYQAGPAYFWRVLAYIAVFHFIRQQYGFLRIYDRQSSASTLDRYIDQVTIYAATIYPLLYWHLSGDRNFHWFVAHDFFNLQALKGLMPLITIIYALILLVYALKEGLRIVQQGYINLPKNLLVLGTDLSWYIGIVWFNGDLIFTLLNVVSHGIPYIALVWVYGRNKSRKEPVSGRFRLVFSPRFVIVFILSIITLAYLEEGLWDALVWKDHGQIFPLFGPLSSLKAVLSDKLMVPLLVVPQLTHYVMDGFIWKLKKDKFNWKHPTLGT